MSDTTDYTPEEFRLLAKLPAHVGFMVMIADRPSWLARRAEIRELRAAATRIALRYPDNALVQRLAPLVEDLLALDALVRHSRDKNIDAVLELIVDECTQVDAILAAKSTPAEAEGYRRFALDLGVHTAEAYADAEFFGIGGQTISRNERRVLHKLREALGLPDEE